MASMSPDDIHRQATTMRSMCPAALRSMNPQMANMTGEERVSRLVLSHRRRKRLLGRGSWDGWMDGWGGIAMRSSTNGMQKKEWGGGHATPLNDGDCM